MRHGPMLNAGQHGFWQADGYGGISARSRTASGFLVYRNWLLHIYGVPKMQAEGKMAIFAPALTRATRSVIQTTRADRVQHATLNSSSAILAI